LYAIAAPIKGVYRDRLLEGEIAAAFFERVLAQARKHHLLSDEHFTVDGTLIKAWAGQKSFRRKEEPPAEAAPPDDPGNPTVNFHGEKRSNATHQSTTDPQARRDLEPDDAGRLYFQDVGSYWDGVRYATATGEARATFIMESADKPWIFGFKQALEMLMTAPTSDLVAGATGTPVAAGWGSPRLPWDNRARRWNQPQESGEPAGGDHEPNWWQDIQRICMGWPP
jgi:hypothetical protein